MTFATVLERGSEALLDAALLVAKDEYPSLDLSFECSRVEALADSLGSLADRPATAQIERMARFLYDDRGFRGNHEDYYDPRNSFINDVLDRGVGIPITLAVLYVEVARRAGVRASGVAFPGHFLVRIEDRSLPGPRFVDPFYGGSELGRDALGELYRRATRSDHPIDDSVLAPSSATAIVLRILANLRGIYSSRGDHARLMLVSSRMLELAPDQADVRRDRGLAAARLGAGEVAAADLREYLATAEDAPDREEIRRVVDELSSTPPTLN